MIRLENNPKLGYYTVGQIRHYIKPEALIAATKHNQFPEWHFNRDVFDVYAWHQEPEIGLRELYRMRAQQLRDKYDYIRLEVSGGGDSATAAFSFILNGIH
jgi:hypothetical protein